MSRNNKTFWVLTSVLGAVLVCAEDWPQFGFQSDRSRATPELIGGPFSTDPGWAGPKGLPDGGLSSPVVADGVVLVATRAGAVRAYDETTGALLWEKWTGDEVIATPLLLKGRAYVPSTDHKIHVYRLETGEEFAPIATGGIEMSSPTTDGASIYLGLSFPNVAAAKFGVGPWKTPLEQLTYSSPALADGKVYLGCDSGRWYCLDASTGIVLWTYVTGGSVLLSSPLVEDDWVYLLPGGTSREFFRVNKDPALWGTNGLPYEVPEPALLFGGYQTSRYRISSPVTAGGLAVFLMSFDQYHDTDGDFYSDTIVMREYLVGVDRATMTEAWPPILLASKTETASNRVPQLGLCPSPAVYTDPSGNPMVVAASSIAKDAWIYDVTGTLTETLTTDTPTRASPIVANTRILIATEQSLYAFRGATNAPPQAPTSFAPIANANVTDSTPDISWTAAADDDAALTYIVRWDTDGNVLLDHDPLKEIVTAGTTVTLPSIAADTQITYAVRTRDPKGALSPWSAPQQFWVNRNMSPPAPPGNVRASPGDSQVTLTWSASPSPDVAGYWLSVNGGAYTPVGNGTSTVVGGLINNTVNVFRLLARDYDGMDSAFVEVSATPYPLISLNGFFYSTLAAAAAAAVPGDAIDLGAGTINLSSTVDLKAGVTIAGAGPHLTIINGPGLAVVIRVAAGAGTAVIRRVTVTGGTVGIDANGYSLDLWNVVLRHLQTGLTAPGGSAVRVVNVTAAYNTIAGFDVGIATFEARNCIVVKNGAGFSAATGAALLLTYNNVAMNTTADYAGAAPGTGSTSNAIDFLNEAALDFREPDGTPAADAGDPADPFDQEPADNGARINQGAFGNTTWAAHPFTPAGAGGGGGGGLCGLVGLDAILLLAVISLVRRRRRC